MWEKISKRVNDSESKSFINKKYLEESYKNCISTGIDRELSSCQHVITGDQLKKVTISQASLIAYTRKLFSEISRDLTDQGHLFVLTDKNATIIEMMSHPRVLQVIARETGIRLGTSLKEGSCGTNAVIMSIMQQELAVVCGKQHFCRLFQDWNCIAAPIIDSTGETLACVNISTSIDAPLGEKMSLIQYVAKDIQEFIEATCTDPIYKQNAYGNMKSNIGLVTLTKRQREVLILYADGLSYKQIAKKLGLKSIRTVEEHLDVIRAKLAATNRRQCIRRALDHGLL